MTSTVDVDTQINQMIRVFLSISLLSSYRYNNKREGHNKQLILKIQLSRKCSTNFSMTIILFLFWRSVVPIYLFYSTFMYERNNDLNKLLSKRIAI